LQIIDDEILVKLFANLRNAKKIGFANFGIAVTVDGERDVSATLICKILRDIGKKRGYKIPCFRKSQKFFERFENPQVSPIDAQEFQELTKDIDPEKKDALEKILNRFYDLKKK
jgi:hypothetical protein